MADKNIKSILLEERSFPPPAGFHGACPHQAAGPGGPA